MTAATKSGRELFIVDNSETEWKGLRYLQDWTEIASAFDIVTGFFEIGSLLALDGKWQKLDRIIRCTKRSGGPCTDSPITGRLPKPNLPAMCSSTTNAPWKGSCRA
jgi:hypothetical protein